MSLTSVCLQAIVQSPGFTPIKNDPEGLKTNFQVILNKTGCVDVHCLRRATATILGPANNYFNSNGIDGGVLPGPAVDGDMVPDVAGKLLLDGRYHKCLEGIVSANNAREV